MVHDANVFLRVVARRVDFDWYKCSCILNRAQRVKRGDGGLHMVQARKALYAAVRRCDLNRRRILWLAGIGLWDYLYQIPKWSTRDIRMSDVVLAWDIISDAMLAHILWRQRRICFEQMEVLVEPLRFSFPSSTIRLILERGGEQAALN